MDGAHEPVLLAESMEALAVRPGGTYVDGTLGLGGHTREILERSAPNGTVLGIDKDGEALVAAQARLLSYGERLRLNHADYRAVPDILEGRSVDGILLDLGVSSLQLDTAERGFSFRLEGPLDMRMDPSQGPSARDVVSRLPEHDLADVIYRYGEERASRRIARAIVLARRKKPLETTGELASIVRRAAGRSRRPGLDPATRTFQALRIYVNRELEALPDSLADLARCLAPGGRLVVISFHSLEDREVKQTFRSLASQGFSILTRKPVTPSPAERGRNPRSRSAKLRALLREAA